MLSKNKRIMSLISSSIDAALLIVAYLLANWMRFRCLPFLEEGGAGPALEIARNPLVTLGWAVYAVAMVLIYWGYGLYDASRLKGLWQRSRTIAVGNALGVVGFMALLYCFRLQNFSRLVMLLLYGLATGFLVFKRLVDAEEVPHFVKNVLRQLVDALVLVVGRVAERDRDDFFVVSAVVDHRNDADGVAAHQRHRLNRLRAEDENVQRVVVVAVGARNEAVIRRIVRRGVENAVKPQQSALLVQFVFFL